MATDLQGAVTVQVSMTNTNTVDLRSIVDSLSLSIPLTLTNGTGANQATQIFSDTRTTDATGETLDFNGGGLTDAFGNAIAMTRMVALILTASTANATAGGGGASLDINVERVATAGMGILAADGDILLLKPGMTVAFLVGTATGVTMTAGDTDSLKFAASAAGNVTYTITIIGSGA